MANINLKSANMSYPKKPPRGALNVRSDGFSSHIDREKFRANFDKIKFNKPDTEKDDTDAEV